MPWGPVLRVYATAFLFLVTLSSPLNVHGQAAGTIPGQVQVLGAGGIFDYSTVAADKNGNVTIPGQSLGYRQNQQTAVLTSRDSVLYNIPRPEDFCVTAKSGINDAAPCWNAAISFLASSNYPNAVKTLYPSWSPNGYYFGSVNYLINLPRHFGDYHGAAGFASPANVAAVFANGQLTSCTATGGKGYTPNALLPVQFVDSTYSGSGANANVATDASGNTTSCTPTTPGMRYPALGTLAYVIPLGGDGAAGTISLSSGSLTAPVITASGNGYATGLTAAALGLTHCNPLPVLTPIVTNAHVTGITITNAGANCLSAGSSNASGITVAFGASCGGAQCKLVPPGAPNQIGCSVALRSGVDIVGIGRPQIHTNFELQPTNTVDLTTTVPFCDPWGDQATVPTINPDSSSPSSSYSMRISGLSVNGFIDFYFSGIVEAIKFTDMTFLGGAPIYGASIMRNRSFTNGTTFTSTSITNSVIETYTGPLCCMGFTSRNPASGAGGVLGGNQMGHPTGDTPEYWGTARNFVLSDLNVFPGAAQVNFTLAANIDKWFEQYLWQSQNGPATPTVPGITALLSNGSTTCPITQIVTDVTTDFTFGQPYVGANQTKYPYFMCYPGVAGGGIEFMPRFWFGVAPYFVSNNVEMRHINFIGTLRPILAGSFGNISGYDLYLDNGIGGAPPDPYLPSGQTHHAISVFGPQAITGEVTTLSLDRTPYNDAIQARQWGATSPFANGIALHNVWNQPDKSYPLPIIATPASPSSGIVCYPGTILGIDAAQNEYPCGTDGHPRKQSLGTTF